MSFAVGEFLAGPSTGLIEILKYLLFLVFMIHLPFVFMTIGGTSLSLLFNFLDRDKPNSKFLRFSQEVLEKSIFNPWVGFLLGVVPMATAILLFYQYLYNTPLTNFGQFWGTVPFDKWGIVTPTFAYGWWDSVVLVAVGYFFIYLYKAKFSKRQQYFLPHFLSGFVGVILVLFGYFIFIAHETFLLYPTMWSIVDNPLQMIFGSTILTSFGIFVHLAFLFSGVALLFSYVWLKKVSTSATAFMAIFFALIPLPFFLALLGKTEGNLSALLAGKYMVFFFLSTLLIVALGFLFFKPKDDQEHGDKEETAYLKFVHKTGLVTTLVFTLGLPVPIFINLFFLEEAAVSTALVFSCFAMLFTTMLLALAVGWALFNLEKPWEKWILPLAILIFFFFLFNEQTSRANAMREQILYLKDHAAQAEKSAMDEDTLNSILHAGGGKSNGAGMNSSAKKGYGIFRQKCATCHTVNGTKKLGPSFQNLWGSKIVVITDKKVRTLTVDEAYIKRSILTPRADQVKGFPNIMTPQNLGDKQILQMVEFFKALKKMEKAQLDQLEKGK